MLIEKLDVGAGVNLALGKVLLHHFIPSELPLQKRHPLKVLVAPVVQHDYLAHDKTDGFFYVFDIHSTELKPFFCEYSSWIEVCPKFSIAPSGYRANANEVLIYESRTCLAFPSLSVC